MSAAPIIVLEQFFNEIQSQLIRESAQKALDQGQLAQTILKPLYELQLPEAAKLLTAFEKAESSLVHFLRVKRRLLESKKWLEAIDQAGKVFYEGKAIPDEWTTSLTDAEAAVNDQLLLVNSRIPSVFAAIKVLLPTDYTASLAKANAELEQIMQRQIARAKEKDPAKEQSWRQFLELSKIQLSLFATLCLEQREVRLKALLQEGRSMYFTKFPNLPFSLLNVWNGSIYVIMDVIGQMLGQGDTKIVTRAVNLETGKIVAVIKPRTVFQTEKTEEEVRSLRERTFVQSWRESDILLRLKGTPGIISIIERIPFEIDQLRHLFLVEDRYEDGSLDSYFDKVIIEKNLDTTVNERTAISIALQLLTGLAKMHQLQVFHRDIKADNILCDWTDPDFKRAVICDFNLACTPLEKELHKRIAFTPIYGAPEYAAAYLQRDVNGRDKLAKASTFSVDIWSMGLVLYQLFFLEPLPWKRDPIDDEAINQVCSDISHLTQDWIPAKFSKHRFFPLIHKMLQVDPSKRITASAALAECQRLSQMI
ncbi:MAG: serine/threonine-protein kinase [Parachlamydiales bacterium]|nr:serine/threonine-protein kinase [Candidatus Acheromyda pituitae]